MREEEECTGDHCDTGTWYTGPFGKVVITLYSSLIDSQFDRLRLTVDCQLKNFYNTLQITFNLCHW